MAQKPLPVNRKIQNWWHILWNPATQTAGHVSTVYELAELGFLGKNRGMRSHRAMAGTYSVQSGDTLTSIAADYGISLAQLEGMNSDIQNFDVIDVGQEINVPDPASSAAPAAGGAPVSAASVVSGQASNWIYYALAAGAVAAGLAVMHNKKIRKKLGV